MSDYLERTNNGTSFVGSDVEIFRLTALASGLAMYAKHKILPNRAWTPKNMLVAAERATGQKFTGKDKYFAASAACATKADELKRAPREA